MAGPKTAESAITTLPVVNDVPELLFITPTHTGQRIIRDALDEHSDTPLKSRGFLADSVAWASASNHAVIGPVLGAPAVVAAVEPLLASGAKRILLFGVVGGIPSERRQIKIGDLLFPGWAIAEDGTSALYESSGKNKLLRDEFQRRIQQWLSPELAEDQLVGVWTTDAPYRETKIKAEQFSLQGVDVVEMEYAALLQLANTYEAELAAAFVVSDLLGGESGSLVSHEKLLRSSCKVQRKLSPNIWSIRMERKQIAIIGAGAVGGVLAWKIEKGSKDDVCFVAQGERHVRLAEKGLLINGEPFTCPVIDPFESPKPVDLIVLAVKAEQLAEVLPLIEPLLTDTSVILPLLNGLESEEQVAAAYGMDRVLYGYSVKIAITRIGNELTPHNSGKIVFGKANNEVHSQQVTLVQGILERADIELEIPENMIHSMWWKFMVNVGINPTSAILRANYGVFQRFEQARHLMHTAIDEVLAVGKKEGVVLNENDVTAWVEILDGLGPEGKTSMLQDLEAGRKTEIELFSGKVSTLGKKHNVATPLNDAMLQMIQVLEQQTGH